MKEIRAILSTYGQKGKGEKVALATVVRVEGSSYRRMGARMLVSENGTWVGGISGGCLEGDALKRARMAILKKRASIITYDTSIDDDNQIGVGLGCNGIIDILFSPIDENELNNPIETLKIASGSPRKVRTLVTITSCENKQLLGKLFEFEGLDNLSFLGNLVNVNALSPTISNIEKSKNIIVNPELTLFVEILPPPLHLLLFGHQYDVYPLIRQIKEMGWDYTVVAPKAKIKDENVIEPSLFSLDKIDNFTAAILMSHSLQTDKENLKTLLPSPIKYIGMLGPRVRSERIFNELGINNDVKNIYAPTGLDIGATNPEEIALSILAEIKSVFSDRTAAHLRERDEPIHSRDLPMNFN